VATGLTNHMLALTCRVTVYFWVGSLADLLVFRDVRTSSPWLSRVVSRLRAGVAGPMSPLSEDSVKDGVPSVHVGVEPSTDTGGVHVCVRWPRESTDSEERLSPRRYGSRCTSDRLTMSSPSCMATVVTWGRR